LRQDARALGSPLDAGGDQRCWLSATRRKYAGGLRKVEQGMEDRRGFWKQATNCYVCLYTTHNTVPASQIHTEPCTEGH